MKNEASNEKVSTEKESKESGKSFPRDREQMDKQLRDLVEVIHFTEKVSAKIHGVLDEAEIYRTVKEEFAKSERYNASIFLLTDDGSKVRLAETSLSPEKVKAGEKIVGLRSYKSYRIDVNKSSFFSHVVKEGKTVEASFVDFVGELFLRPLSYLIMKGIGYEKRTGILTPLKKHGKVIGVLVVDSVLLAEHFIPSVKNLAQHISTALELAEQHAERKKSEETLNESEEKHRKLFEEAMDAIFVADAETGIIVDCNRAALDLVGYKKAELVGQHQSILHPQEEIEGGFTRGFKQHLKEQDSVHETKVITKKGEIKDVAVKANLIEIKGRKMLQGIFRDITEHKKAEEALRSEREMLEMITQNIGAGLTIISKDYRILWANKVVKEFCGDVEGKVCYSTFHQLTHICPGCGVKEIFETGKNQVVHERVVSGFSGQNAWLENITTPIRDENENITAVLELSVNITERKKMEEALRESEKRYKNLFENARDVIFTADLKGNITNINRFVEEYGFKRDELVGKNMLKFVPKKYWPRLLRGVAKLSQGNVVEGEIEIITPKGKIISGYRGNPIRRGKKVVGFQSILRNITERKNSQAKLLASEKKYRKLFENLKLAEKQLLEERDRAQNYLDIADVLLVALDTKGRVTLLNRKGCAILKCTAEEALGKNWFDNFLPKNTKNNVKKIFQASIKGKKCLLDYNENYVISKGREARLIAWHNVLLRNSRGQVIGTLSSGEDITEWKKAQQALIDSEEKFRSIVESSNDVVMLTLPGGVVSYMSPACFRVLGYNPEDLVGTRPSIFHPDDLELVTKTLSKALKGERGTDFEYRIITKAGETRWISHSWSPMLENGKVKLIVSVVRGITERKKMEEAVRESEEKYRDIVELAPDGIATLDMKGIITSCNTAATRLIGYSKDEIVGKHFSKLGFLRARDIPKYLQLMSFAVRGKVPKSLEVSCIRKDGTPYSSEVRFGLLRKGGKTVGYLVIGRDITERKAMEEKLKQYSERLEELVQKRTEELLESEKRYSVLVEEASDGVVIVQDEKIVFINRKGAEISYHSKDELIGLPFEQLLDEKYRQSIKEGYALLLQGETVPLTVELEVIAKNGEVVPVEVSVARISYQRRPAILAMLRDIKERKRMEEQRLKLGKLASMGELATMVAHDLRNPLTSIRNASYYIKNSCPARAKPECNTAIEMLDIIEQETIFANNIINDLLDFAAKRPLQKNKQNINEIIEDSLTANKIPENVTVKRNFEKAIATVDGKQLERVFLNLIKNAVQVMPNGGKLTIATNETKDHIEIEFTDTGVGISEENMSKLFEPLFTTKAKGIGMGLAICKKIVEEHGGTIEVKSKVGQGTTFTIKLPKKEEANAQ